MSPPNKKPHLSPSQMNFFYACGYAYERQYINKERLPSGIAALKGTGYHHAAEQNMKQKVDTHADLKPRDVMDIAVARFEADATGEIALTLEEASRGTTVVLADAKDELAEIAFLHAKQQAPDYQPILVEQAVRIDLPGPRDLLAVIDLADDQDRVTDFKSSKRKISQANADSSLQLTVYAAAFESFTGRPAKETRLDNIVRGKRDTKRHVMSSQRGQPDFATLANRINAMTIAIEKGTFAPAAPGSWQCSSKWCGFWRTCPYVRHDRDREDDEGFYV